MDKDSDKKDGDITNETYVKTMEMAGGPLLWICMLLSYFGTSLYGLWVTY